MFGLAVTMLVWVLGDAFQIDWLFAVCVVAFV
jgi:hypothetical protein